MKRCAFLSIPCLLLCICLTSCGITPNSEYLQQCEEAYTALTSSDVFHFRNTITYTLENESDVTVIETWYDHGDYLKHSSSDGIVSGFVSKDSNLFFRQELENGTWTYLGIHESELFPWQSALWEDLNIRVHDVEISDALTTVSCIGKDAVEPSYFFTFSSDGLASLAITGKQTDSTGVIWDFCLAYEFYNTPAEEIAHKIADTYAAVDLP